MDENDFKRLLEENAAETQSGFKRLLEENSTETHRRIDANAAETQQRFDQADARAAETNARLENVEARTAETNARLETVEARTAELKQHIDKTAAQMKVDFGTIAEDMRTDVQRVADGVLMVNAKLDREAADIRAEMRQGFAETQALLRFSHGQLDGRVTALERAAKR